MADDSIAKANFPAEFEEYVRDEGLSYASDDTLSQWVFWNRNYGNLRRRIESGAVPHSLGELRSSIFSIEDRTVAALAATCLDLDTLNLCFLLQFWAPKKGVDGRLLLTTSGQPFCLSGVREGLCSYRVRCLRRKLYLDKEELGHVERVFRGGIPELSPDVQFYSETEYPHHADATSCKIRQSLVMPLIERYSDRKDCIGVLEVVTTGETYGGIIKNNIVSYARFGFQDHYEDRVCYEFTDYAENHEIKKMLVEVCAEHHLALAQTWLLYKGIDGNVRYGLRLHINGSLMNSMEQEDFWHVCLVQKRMLMGQGVVGRAFSSHNSCFCNNVTKFTMSQYPLAHHARRCGLTSSFAVYLEHIRTEGEGCVVEFFLPTSNPSDPSGTGVKTPLYSIMATMKRHLRTFKIPTSEEFGGSSQICQTSQRLLPTPEILHSGGDSDQLQLSRDQQFRETAFCHSEAMIGPSETIQAMKQDSSMVTIKATYTDTVLKFPFALSSGVAQLAEEVAKRLKLEIGGFVLKYKNEEGDCVLIADDPDLL